MATVPIPAAFFRKSLRFKSIFFSYDRITEIRSITIALIKYTTEMPFIMHSALDRQNEKPHFSYSSSSSAVIILIRMLLKISIETGGKI